MKNIDLIKFKMADLRSLLTLIYFLTGKSCQIARPLLSNKRCGFREGYVPKNFHSYQIKNGCHAAIIDFKMRNILKNRARVNIQFKGSIFIF